MAKLPKLPKFPKLPKSLKGKGGKGPKLPKLKTPKVPSMKGSLLSASPILSFYKGNYVGMIFNVILLALFALNVYILMNPPSNSVNYSSFGYGVMAIATLCIIAFNIFSAAGIDFTIGVNIGVLLIIGIPVITTFVRVLSQKEEKKEESKV